MDKQSLLEKLAEAQKQLDIIVDGHSHVGVALEITAYIRDYITSSSSEMADRMYDDPFYTFFQNACHDTHSPFPIRKMSMISALDGYRRYLGESEPIVH